MSKKVRLIDIAQECGVTKGLVSRALAGKYNVGDNTRNLIMKKAVELGYDFEKLRSYSKKQSSVLLIISSRILLKEDFWQPIIKNIYSTLNRQSIKLEYFVFDESDFDESSLKTLKNNSCKAYIILHANPSKLFKFLEGTRKPILEIDPKYLHSNPTTIIKFSNYTSIYEATQTLISCGHKTICFYGSDMYALSFRERHEGFLACIDMNKKKGIKGISAIFDNTSMQYGDNKLLTEILEQNNVTAIICANDICAFNAYKVITKLGKKVPEDISLIGFDNVVKEFDGIRLSTFNVPREELGELVGSYIVSLQQANRIKFSELVIRCEYIEGNSIKKMGVDKNGKSN